MIVSQIPPGQGQQPHCLGIHSRHGFIEFINLKSKKWLYQHPRPFHGMFWTVFIWLKKKSNKCLAEHEHISIPKSQQTATLQGSLNIYCKCHRDISMVKSIVCLLTLFPCPHQPGRHLPCGSTTSSLHILFTHPSPLLPTPPGFILWFSSSVFCQVGYVICLLRYRKTLVAPDDPCQDQMPEQKNFC